MTHPDIIAPTPCPAPTRAYSDDGWPPERVVAALDLARAGVPCKAAAQQLGTSKGAMLQALDRRGLGRTWSFYRGRGRR